MQAKHRRTLENMFKTPMPANIKWTEIITVLKAASVEIHERSGSRVLFKKAVECIVIHRPHPESHTGRATVRDIVAFLKAIGVKP